MNLTTWVLNSTQSWNIWIFWVCIVKILELWKTKTTHPALRELQKRQKFKTFIFLSQNSIKYVNNVKTKWIRLLQNSLIFVMHKRHKIKTFRCPVTKLNQRCYNCQNYFYAGMKLFQILVCRKTKNARTF